MGRKSSHERPNDSLKRTPGNKVIKAILIVGEGETEEVYFKHIKREFSLTLVEIERDHSAPISVVKKAIELYKARQREVKKAKKQPIPSLLNNKPMFDQVWCVFDRERPEHNSTFDQAVDRALAHKFELALSNPSLEYWFLLHIKDTTQPFTKADEIIKELNVAIRGVNKNNRTPIDEYRKHETKFIKESLPEFIQTIFPQLEQALVRAANTMPKRISNDPPNPSTGVGKLVETLKAMKRP